MEAFGRKPEFDPKTDTIVRVQTHRLRQKLRDKPHEYRLRRLFMVASYCAAFGCIRRGQHWPVYRFVVHEDLVCGPVEQLARKRRFEVEGVGVPIAENEQMLCVWI